MNTTRRSAVLAVALVLFVCGPLACLRALGQTRSDAGAASAPDKAGDKPRIITSKDGLMSVDLRKRQVVLKAEVCLQDDHQYLEFLLSGWGDKTHESLLHTRVKGRQIHFAMLLLGLRPGKAAEWIYIDEDRSANIPPRGGACTMRIRYTDKQGKPHEVDARDWMLSAPGQETAPPEKFIFVGSRVLADGSYWADQDGELVSVANFRSAVFDVPFESTSSDQHLLFMANRDKMQPRGTAVELVIKPVEGAEKTPHVRSLLEIDRLGRLKVDGEPIAADKLRPWAAKLTNAHLKAMVEIRAAPDARVGDVRWAREELKLGGIFETEVIRLARLTELPRTPEARSRLLAQWAKRFDDPANYMGDQGERAAETIRLTRERIAELQAVIHVMDEYANDLEAARKRFVKDNPPQAEDADRP
jgi:hypothetical protein